MKKFNFYKKPYHNPKLTKKLSGTTEHNKLISTSTEEELIKTFNNDWSVSIEDILSMELNDYMTVKNKLSNTEWEIERIL